MNKITCSQSYPGNTIELISEDQVRFSLMLELINKMNDINMIRFRKEKSDNGIMAIAEIYLNENTNKT
jgi:hypothetical protein